MRKEISGWNFVFFPTQTYELAMLEYAFGVDEAHTHTEVSVWLSSL